MQCKLFAWPHPHTKPFNLMSNTILVTLIVVYMQLFEIHLLFQSSWRIVSHQKCFCFHIFFQIHFISIIKVWIIRSKFHLSDDSIRFCVYKWQHCKYVNTPTRLNTHFILIYDLKMPRICLGTNVTFENCSSLMCHQVKWSSHAVGSMDNLLNKDNFSITNACEGFSIDVSTPNMLLSFSSYSLGLWILHYWTIRFS